jgi:hypothetical protein
MHCAASVDAAKEQRAAFADAGPAERCVETFQGERDDDEFGIVLWSFEQPTWERP